MKPGSPVLFPGKYFMALSICANHPLLLFLFCPCSTPVSVPRQLVHCTPVSLEYTLFVSKMAITDYDHGK